MAVHAPVHQLGTTQHPHTLRYALLAVGAAIVVIAALVVADVVKLTPSSVTTGDKLTTPLMVQFRAGERAVGQVTGDKLIAPVVVQFRAEERAFAYPTPYTGPLGR